MSPPVNFAGFDKEQFGLIGRVKYVLTTPLRIYGIDLPLARWEFIEVDTLASVFSFILGSPEQLRPLLSTAEQLARQTFKNLRVRRR